MMLEYTNMRDWEPGEHLRGRITLETFDGLWGALGTIDETATKLSGADPLGAGGGRFGVKVNFIVRGQIGSPSFFRVVQHFVSSAVLVSIVNFVTLLWGRVLSTCEPKSNLCLLSPGEPSAHHPSVADGASSAPVANAASSSSTNGGGEFVPPPRNPLKTVGSDHDDDDSAGDRVLPVTPVDICKR